ncbi:MAG: low molecular weight phosphatase family protein [Syntrophobacteraceae bacterium]
MKKGLLFVCYANACRSIMAEALAKHHCGELFTIASAGIAALHSVPQNTLAVLNEVDVSSEGLYSKGIDEIDTREFDLIVNLADVPIERFISKGLPGRIVAHYVSDPYGRGLNAYRESRDMIERLILRRFPEWLGDDHGN